MLLAILITALAVAAEPNATNILDYREARTQPSNGEPITGIVPVNIPGLNGTEAVSEGPVSVLVSKNVSSSINKDTSKEDVASAPVTHKNSGLNGSDVINIGAPASVMIAKKISSKVNETDGINNGDSISVLVQTKSSNYQDSISNLTEPIRNDPLMLNVNATVPEDSIMDPKFNLSEVLQNTLLIPKFSFLKLKNESGVVLEHQEFRQNLSQELKNKTVQLMNKTDRTIPEMSEVFGVPLSKNEAERTVDISRLKEALNGVPSDVLARLSPSTLKKRIDHILHSRPSAPNAKNVPVVRNDGTVDSSSNVLARFASNTSAGMEAYNTYMDSDMQSANVAPLPIPVVEESPAYASSVVLASDILSLSSAVAEVNNKLCRDQGYRFLDGLLNNRRWALKMFDASAKSPQGLLFGSSYHLGNFDECVAVQEEGAQTHRPLAGKYCLATIEWKQSEAVRKQRSGRSGELRWAVCVPDACGAADVRQFVLDVLSRTVGNTSRVLVDEHDCYTRAAQQYSPLDDAFLGLISFFALVLVICTALDLWWARQSDKRHSVLQGIVISFSATHNVRKLLSTKQPNGFGLDCIAGIKTLAMVFITAGHACLFIASGPVMDAEAWDRLLRQPLNSFMLNNTLLVDTFLMLSAFLFCRLLLLELDKRRGSVNVIPIYIFRYIRVTPAYLVVILFYMTWLPKSGEGPLWKDKLELERERCSANWWANILYVNNYVNSDSLCMFQSWYLSVDTQLFFLAPAFIYPLWRWRRVGPVVLSVATAVSAIIPAVVTYENKLDPTLMVYAKEFKDISQNDFFKTAYIKTHMKMTPYFMGLWFGYILHRLQANNYKFSTTFKAAAWVASVVFGTSVVFSISLFYQEWYQYSVLDSASYAALHKLAWGLANGWLIIACATGNGGILGRLLTWKFLVPISRLTFCAYLVNGVVELYFIGTLRHPLHISFFNVFAIAVAHILLTFILALVLCLVFESPIHGIEKVLLRTFVRPSDKVREDLSADCSSRSTSQPKLDV